MKSEAKVSPKCYEGVICKPKLRLSEGAPHFI